MSTKNNLYPIFLKTEQLDILIVGGGNVALEKLTYLIKSSPDARVKLLAKEFIPEVQILASKHTIKIVEHTYRDYFLNGIDFLIVATDDRNLNEQIYRQARSLRIPTNVADTPDLCDFYLGGIVTKGNVKIAISTNGKSPTLAKRLRQFFEYTLPDDLNELSEVLNEYRHQIRGEFQTKVKALNKLTQGLVQNNYID